MVKIMEIFLMILKKKKKKKEKEKISFYDGQKYSYMSKRNTLFNILQNKTKRTEESKQIVENN